MPRKPQIAILANAETEFSTAHIGKRLVAVRWRVENTWYVATPANVPQTFSDISEAFEVFFAAAMKAADEPNPAERRPLAPTTCVCCSPGDCGDRRGHVRNDQENEWQCNCGRDWPCEKASA